MDNTSLLTAEQRKVFFAELYKKAFYSVARYVAKMGGSLEEAQDIFQDALIVFYEKITSSQAEMVVNEKAYVTGIAKNLWLQRYKTTGKNQSLNGFDMEDAAYEETANDKILEYLETAGKKCLDLLKAFYYDRLTVSKVTTLFGYSGTHSATVAKYKCLEKVRDTVKQNSLSYADFIE